MTKTADVLESIPVTLKPSVSIHYLQEHKFVLYPTKITLVSTQELLYEI